MKLLTQNEKSWLLKKAAVRSITADTLMASAIADETLKRSGFDMQDTKTFMDFAHTSFHQHVDYFMGNEHGILGFIEIIWEQVLEVPVFMINNGTANPVFCVVKF